MLRTTKLASRAVAQRTGRVDWSACTTAYSPPALKESLAGLERRLQNCRTIISQAPQQVAEVDFDKYLAAGVDAASVAAIKKEHEAALAAIPEPAMGSEWKVFEEFLTAFKNVSIPKIEAAQALKEDCVLRKKLLQEEFLTSASWTMEDWERAFPGIIQKCEQLFVSGQVHQRPELTVTMDDVDMGKALAQLKAGERPTELLVPQAERQYIMSGISRRLVESDIVVEEQPEEQLLPGSKGDALKWQQEWGPVWAKLA